MVRHRSTPCVALVGLAILALSARASAQACERSSELDAAAAALIYRSSPPNADDVIRAVRTAGSDVPVVDAMLLGRDPGSRDRFLSAARSRHRGPLRCGEIAVGERTFIVVGPGAARLRLSDDGLVVVSLAPGWSDAHLFVRAADGESWTDRAVRGRSLRIPDGLERPLRIQLVASDAAGPRPVAERWLGTMPVTPDLTSDASALERLRSLRLGSVPLRDNRLLARVALAHAETQCRENVVAHTNGETDPEQRLARAGIGARHVGETIARASDLDAAFRRLAASPSHHLALTDRRFTDVGIGQVERDDGDVCLVVLLAAWPRPIAVRASSEP